jgi:hypothetical protein
MELSTKADKPFMECVYKLLRDWLQYTPRLTIVQFFTTGFAQPKAEMAFDIVDMIVKKATQISTAVASSMPTPQANGAASNGQQVVSKLRTSNLKRNQLVGSAHLTGKSSSLVKSHSMRINRSPSSQLKGSHLKHMHQDDFYLANNKTPTVERASNQNSHAENEINYETNENNFNTKPFLPCSQMPKQVDEYHALMIRFDKRSKELEKRFDQLEDALAQNIDEQYKSFKKLEESIEESNFDYEKRLEKLEQRILNEKQWNASTIEQSNVALKNKEQNESVEEVLAAMKKEHENLLSRMIILETQIMLNKNQLKVRSLFIFYFVLLFDLSYNHRAIY